MEGLLSTGPTPSSFNTNKGLTIHIGKAHKSVAQQKPEMEHSTSTVEEPTLTINPIKESDSEEEEDPVISEEIIDCEVKKT